MNLRNVAVVLTILAAAGCATTTPSSPSPSPPGAPPPAAVTSSLNLSGFPPEFRRGFTDGCASSRAGDISSRPKGDGQYAVGWNDGFDYCKAKK